MRDSAAVRTIYNRRCPVCRSVLRCSRGSGLVVAAVRWIAYGSVLSSFQCCAENVACAASLRGHSAGMTAEQELANASREHGGRLEHGVCVFSNISPIGSVTLHRDFDTFDTMMRT